MGGLGSERFKLWTELMSNRYPLSRIIQREQVDLGPIDFSKVVLQCNERLFKENAFSDSPNNPHCFSIIQNANQSTQLTQIPQRNSFLPSFSPTIQKIQHFNICSFPEKALNSEKINISQTLQKWVKIMPSNRFYPEPCLTSNSLAIGQNGCFGARIDSDYKLSELINSLAVKATKILTNAFFSHHFHHCYIPSQGLRV